MDGDTKVPKLSEGATFNGTLNANTINTSELTLLRDDIEEIVINNDKVVIKLK